MPEPPPLSGIKVVDLTRYLAGPFCTQILGEYGAEVIKVEPVENPRSELGGGSTRDSYFFLSCNRSKKSVRIATKKPNGQEVLLRLINRADVLVDNFRPGVMKALGLDYETAAARNPRIITCSISGFGSTGPLRDFPGFDQIAQGLSGLMSVTGTVESGPTRVGIAICDLLGGIFAAQGILLALEARRRSGRRTSAGDRPVPLGLVIRFRPPGPIIPRVGAADKRAPVGKLMHAPSLAVGVQEGV